MTRSYPMNPALDLVMERVVDVPPELVWKAWTVPEHLMKWFCPVPWMTVECEIDLRPGGAFHTVMQSPDGERHPGTGCYLEIVENRKLVWTDALEGGWRPSLAPNDCIDAFFTAIVELTPRDGGTVYRVTVRHSTEAARKTHEDRGFEGGWGTALDQLVAYVKTW